MINYIILALLAISFHLATGQSFVIHHVNIISMEEGEDEVLENQTVLIVNGKIKRFGNAEGYYASPKAVSINGEGKYLIPGLIDMHMHFLADNYIPKDYIFDEIHIPLAYGITTARIPIGQPFHLHVRDQIKKEKIKGPDLFVAGHLAGYRYGDDFSVLVVESPGKAAAAVVDLKKEGYDFIKITYGIDAPVFQAIMETARKESIKVFGHVPKSVGIWEALKQGYHIEHLDHYLEGLLPGIELEFNVAGKGIFDIENWKRLEQIGPEGIDKLVKATIVTGVWNTPTNYQLVSSFGNMTAEKVLQKSEVGNLMSQEIKDELLKDFRRFKRNPPPALIREKYVKLRNEIINVLYHKGGRIMAGSGSPEGGNIYGLGLHRELQSMVSAGLSPYEALRTATILPARFLDQEKKVGTVKKGKIANLLLLDANPLEDISNTLKISGVFKGKDWIPGYVLKYLYAESRLLLSKAPLR